MKNLIKVAVTMAFITVATGNLPKILHKLRIAQLHLIQESQASKWPKAMLPISHYDNRRLERFVSHHYSH